jgi:hypothetical protein
MDPTEALKQILLAIADGDRNDVLGYLEDLTGWLETGGALPDVYAVVETLAEAFFEEAATGEDGDEAEGFADENAEDEIDVDED